MRDWFSLRSLLVGAVVVGIALLALPVAAGVGDPVLAGKTNQVDEQTRIKGDVDTPNLKLTNTNPVGMAASFNVEPGNPPFKVSSGERVKLLNADRIDGKHASFFATAQDLAEIELTPGPEGPQGPKGDPGAPADIYTFNVQVPVGGTATLVAAAGFEMTAECGDALMVVKLRHATESWKRASLNSYPAGVAQVVDSKAIVNGFGEGSLPSIDGWSTSGDVFLNADGIVAWLPATQKCLFAGAPYVQAAP